MNEQNNVRIDIVGSASGLRPATAEADADLAKLKASAESTGGGLTSLRTAAEGVGAAVGGMASVVGVAALGWAAYQGLQVNAALAIKDTADELGKLSQRLGVSVESLSGLRYAAELSDLSLSELHGGLKNLANKAQENAPAFKAMGISVRDAAGQMKPLDSLLGEIADKFAGYEDGAAKTALANDVLGRSGEKMIPLLNGGAAGLRGMADEAKKLGVVYSDDLAKKSEEFNDNLTRLKYAAEGMKIALGGDMLTTLARFSEELVQGTKAAGGFFSALMMGVTLNPLKSYGENLQTVRGELEQMEADLKEYGYLDEKRYDRKKAQLEYLKSMQRYEALKLGDGVYSNEGRGAGSGKTEAPVPSKDKKGVTRADPLDALLENYRRDALAQEVGLSSSTVKEIENLGELIVRGKIDIAEYDRLLGAVLDKDAVLRKEQDQAKKAGDLVSDYKRGNDQVLERIKRESELALMTEKQRSVAQALYKVEDDGQKIRERIIRDIADETERTKALAEVDALLADQKERVAAATEKSIDAQRTFEFGWNKAFNSYTDDATNAAKTAETAFTGMTGAMEGAIKSMARNGKIDFAAFGDAVINTLIDIQLQTLRTSVLAPMMQQGGGWLAGLFGLGGSSASSLGIGSQEIADSIGIASVFHEGGVVGAGGASRSVPMGVFSGAQRFHSGGWPGLASDEVPAILQKGERVLSRGDAGGGGVVVNIIESPQKAGTAEQRQEGGQDILEVFVDRVRGAIAGDISRGSGPVPAALNSTYGLGRVAGAY